ncbi:tellurite resistance TerB family protein [Opitutales bacterium ASA1]|uniref:tellurite resistance TerB family protein n=1 Tax=Congregicoccus parvus TaxID=3081749 RepID=UPI002B30F057|nr:tellurite resistance TerB family protein [Opitutales bacterium ASA1]
MPLERLFSELSGSPTAKGALGGAASGAMVAMLLNKKMRKKLTGTALTVGGAAAVAGLGYYAYQKWQQRQATPPHPSASDMRSTFGAPVASAAPTTTASAAAIPPALPPPPRVDDTLALALLQTMIAAANSDGRIDDAELARLESAVQNAGLTAAEEAKVLAALNTPPSIDTLARLPRNPEEAAELYGAAVAAIEADTPAEKFFLRRLATALKLPPDLTGRLDALA